MRANLQNYPAAKARQGEIVLKRPWQRAVFLLGLGGTILLLLVTLFISAAGR